MAEQSQEAEQAPARRPRKWLLIVGLAAVVLAVIHSRGWATQPLVLADGRVFDVLNFDRHLSVMFSPNGARTTEEMFWVRYYATSSDPDAMLEEARRLAPALFPISDSLGLRILRLSPSRPILIRLFPLGVFSREVRFQKDSTGTWLEETR